MKTFLAYDSKRDRILGYTRATSQRAATANLKRLIKGRTFGGRFGLHVMLLSNWTESELDRAGGFAIPRPADVQADMNAAFGWETETCADCGGKTLPLAASVRFCVDCDVETETETETETMTREEMKKHLAACDRLLAEGAGSEYRCAASMEHFIDTMPLTDEELDWYLDLLTALRLREQSEKAKVEAFVRNPLDLAWEA